MGRIGHLHPQEWQVGRCRGLNGSHGRGVEVKNNFFLDVQFSRFLGQIISTLSKKSDYDNFQGLKLIIKKPRCDIFREVQYC